ncbi:MAG: metallophosphoesterase [Promethearchaeota archaeon]
MDESFLEKLLKKPDKISNLRFDEISPIITEAKTIIQEENLILDLQMRNEDDFALVIGDIHGNLESLKKFLNIIKKEHPTHVIFLGDIVDRGAKQLECLITVLCLKILEPKRYVFLRGNHETIEMNRYYGFYDDFHYRFGNKGRYSEIASLYEVLPICAIINEKIACLHGGIPEYIDVFNELKDKKAVDLFECGASSYLKEAIYQILWNDPKEGLKGYMGSYRGPGIKFFGENVFKKFLEKNNLNYLIRAHECFEGVGYRWFFDGRLLSLFSSENYRGDYFPNPAGYAIIKNIHIYPKEFTSL